MLSLPWRRGSGLAPSRTKAAGRIVLVVGLVVAMLAAVVHRDQFATDALEGLLEQVGWWAPLAFILLYAFSALVLLPGTLMNLAGGALFGPGWGTLYNLVGTTVGAVLSFLAARYVASDWVRARTDKRLQRLVRGVEGEGWRFVAFTRLVPIFPYTVLSYAFGLTRIPLLAYTVATFVFTAPAAFAYSYLGFAGREAVTGDADLTTAALFALVLVLATIVLPLTARHQRRRRARR